MTWFMVGLLTGWATLLTAVVWELRSNIRKWENPDD